MNYQSENINELMGALAKAQGKMSGASKDSANPFFKSKYADLNSVWNACREALSENGLAVVQTVQERPDGTICLHTTLGHASGQWMTSTMPIRMKTDGKTNELQVLGSCLSYLRRYSLMALVGVAPGDDDDGNSAGAYTAPQKQIVQQVAAQSPVPRISTPQLSEMRSLLANCDGEFVGKIMKFLSDYNIPNLESMPLTFFDKIKIRVEKYLSETHPQSIAIGES